MQRPLRFGLWYDFRNPPRWQQDPAKLYRAILDQIVRAEELGWDDIWLSEHHFVDDGYTPSMLPLASAIAARTERVRIGTSVLLLPLHDPVRVAEDAATVDLVAGGRFELGVAAGYRREEFEGFGVSRTERGARMDEAVPIVRRLLDGERVTTNGRFYQYQSVELHPQPAQQHLPIWIGGFSEPAARRAARLGDGYIAIGPVAPLVAICHDELARLGRPLDEFEIAAGHAWLLVSDDPERRWREAREHFMYQINLYAEWFAEAGMSVAGAAQSDDDLRHQGILIVTPEQACEQIRRYVEQNKVTRFYGWAVPPGLPPEWSEEHVVRMAEDVLPAFR